METLCTPPKWMLLGKSFSRTMGINMIVHFSVWWPLINLVLIFVYFINYLNFACISVKCFPLSISIRDKVYQSIPCNTVPKLIVGGHTQLLLFISDCRSATSVCSRHLCPDPISLETDHSPCQARIITVCVLNPSGDLVYYPFLIFFFVTYWSGGMSLFIFL